MIEGVELKWKQIDLEEFNKHYDVNLIELMDLIKKEGIFLDDSSIIRNDNYFKFIDFTDIDPAEFDPYIMNLS